MDLELMSWKNEMEKMLAAINRQTTHSLHVINLIFKRCGRSLPPDFKQYFLQTSNNSIRTTYEQFELNLSLEESMDVNLNSVANVDEKPSNNDQSGFTFEANNHRQLFMSPIVTDEMHGTNKSIAHQSNNIVDEEVITYSDFTVETEESNDSIDLIENQDGLIDADDNEIAPVNADFNCSNEKILAKLTEDKRKTMQLNHKKSNGKRTTTTTVCTVCGYTGSKLSRHMRTHTGEKPYRCDLCSRRFTNAESLVKHTKTHIADFPFHCKACFRGFSLEAEAIAHEKNCRKRHYECHLCKKFVTCVKSGLIRHMRIHTGDKPFRCKTCMKHFGWKHVLKQHLDTVHA